MDNKCLNQDLRVKGRKIVPFVENAIYDVAQTAAIIGRSEKVVRALCTRGLLRARKDRGGFSISGWQIRAYAENSCDLLRADSNVK